MSKKKAKEGGLVHLFTKHQVLILILLALTAYTILRLNAASLPVTDRWAQQTLEANYKAAGKQDLIGMPQFSKDVQKLSEQYRKIYTDKEGNQYLQGVDSYYYLRQARGILEGGQANSLLPYLEVYFFRFLKTFSKDAALIQAAFWLPFFVTMLSIILIFFIARKLTDNIGGFFAAFLLAIHPQFFTATQPGFTDTNFLNLFFTLLTVFLFFEGIDSVDFSKGIKGNLRQAACLLALMPVLLLFRYTWNGWYYIFFLMAVFSALYISYTIYARIRDSGFRKADIILLGILVLAVMGGFVLKDKPLIKNQIDHIKSRIGMARQQETMFPSSVSTTSELLSASQAQAMKNSTQGPLLYLLNGWVLAILTLISFILLMKDNKRHSERTKYSLFAVLWFLALFFVGYNSIRFISFFAIPFCIIVSYGSAKICHSAKRYLESKARLKEEYAILSIIAVLLLLITVPLLKDLSERAERTPTMTNIIEKTSDGLKATSRGSMINLWWDKGFFYQYYAERNVTMNNGMGGTSDPKLYWMSRFFMDDDEDEAIKLLEMVSGEPCFIGYVSNPAVNLSKINCAPSNGYYLLVDSGLIGKVDMFEYYVNWDFEEKKHNPYIQSKVPPISSPSKCFPNREKTHLICGENFDLDLAKSRLTYKGAEVPFAIVGDSKIQRSEKKGDYTLLVYPEMYKQGGVYNAVLVRSDLLNSMFIRLYFMKGIGLEHFEPFSDIADPIAGRVIVYKVR